MKLKYIIKQLIIEEINMNELKQLAKRIRIFIDKYAAISPNYNSKFNDKSERFTSPDANMLKSAAELLEQGKIPTRVWSEWGSGGYKPYNDKKGQKEHDDIMTELNKLMNADKSCPDCKTPIESFYNFCPVCRKKLK